MTGPACAARKYPTYSVTPIAALAGRQYPRHNLNPRHPLVQTPAARAGPRRMSIPRAGSKYPAPAVSTAPPICTPGPMANLPRSARTVTCVRCPASSRRCRRLRGVRDVLLACVRDWRRGVPSWCVARERARRTASRRPTGPGRAVASSSTSQPIPIPPSKATVVAVTHKFSKWWQHWHS